MAAWIKDQCVGTLHAYQSELPSWESPDWPAWNCWAPSPQWWEQAASQAGIPVQGKAGCHACFHGGRTLEQERRSEDADSRFAGQGIGTALCGASLRWARDHGYTLVTGYGAPPGLQEFARWMGALPASTYARFGFVAVGHDLPGWAFAGEEPLPDWARGDSPPEVMAEAQAALDEGWKPDSLRQKLMVLSL
jgi:GNAT superfamily N-acetyltransferase